MNSSDQPPPATESEPAPPEPRMSLLGRAMNVFAAPGDVFEEVRDTPPSPSNWVVPILLFIGISWLAAWLMFSQEALQQQFNNFTENIIQKQIDSGRLKAENADQVREVTQMRMKVGAYVSPLFAAWTQPFWWGLIVWLLGAKFFKGNFAYMKAVEVCGLASLISVLGVVVHTLLAVGLSNPFASPSLAVLLKNQDPTTPMFALLNTVNVMTFWELVVRSIGLARLARVSVVKACAWLIGTWLIFQSFCLGLGSLAYSVMPK